METHHIHPELLKHKVRVLVVGCGGNGSAIAAGLPYLHQALLAYGHPEGLQVTLLDADVISRRIAYGNPSVDPRLAFASLLFSPTG
jgi:sulfur-carrier protein adenylyltransferase/sulfurtransferase